MSKRNKPEPDGTLRPRHERAALCLAVGKSIGATCEETGLGRTTLWNLLRKPAFKARVAELREQTVDAALGQTTELLRLAAKTYKDLLTAEDTPQKLKKETADSVYDRFVGLTNFIELKSEIERIKAQLPAK
jgi:hypothetical protein